MSEEVSIGRRVEALEGDVQGLGDVSGTIMTALNSMASHTLALEAVVVQLLGTAKIDAAAAESWLESRLDEAQVKDRATALTVLRDLVKMQGG